MLSNRTSRELLISKISFHEFKRWRPEDQRATCLRLHLVMSSILNRGISIMNRIKRIMTPTAAAFILL